MWLKDTDGADFGDRLYKLAPAIVSDGMAMVLGVPKTVQFGPSADQAAVKLLPERVTRVQTGNVTTGPDSTVGEAPIAERVTKSTR